MGTAMVLVFIVLALIALVVSAATSLARPPAAGRRDGAGLLARLTCPRTGQHAAVRIGRDPVERVPAVVWCERFPGGRIDCGRECFSTLQGVNDATMLMQPA